MSTKTGGSTTTNQLVHAGKGEEAEFHKLDPIVLKWCISTVAGPTNGTAHVIRVLFGFRPARAHSTDISMPRRKVAQI